MARAALVGLAALLASAALVLITRRTMSGALGTPRAHGATIRRQLELGNIVAASVAPADLDAIAADPDVLRVAYDSPMQLQGSGDPLSMASNDMWGGWDSNSTEGLYIGVAPDANLVEFRVSNANGQAYTSDVISAIQWVTNNQASRGTV